MLYPVKIYVSFHYGIYKLVFVKTFQMPIPFYGLSICEHEEGNENNMELVNNEYCKTVINYNVSSKDYDVHIRNIWKMPVTDEEIDNTIDIFLLFDWGRTDDTNTNNLKDLMKRDYERQKQNQ